MNGNASKQTSGHYIFYLKMSIVISRFDIRDYENLPLRWRSSCLRMAALHFGMSPQTFSDMITEDDMYYNRLCMEVVLLRLAMSWSVLSDLEETGSTEETELRESVLTQYRQELDEEEVNSY